MKKHWKRAVVLMGTALSAWTCTTPDPEPSPYESGTYILNAGIPSANNGSISFLPRTAQTATTDIFNAANALPLTGAVQDYTEIDGKGIILVNNSELGKDKIEIVQAGTFKALSTIGGSGVENPRYVVRAGFNKAYVSCWDTTGPPSRFIYKPGYVLVLDLASRTVKKKIPVTRGADRIVVIGNEAFVGTLGGERVVTVINTDTDEVKQPGIDVGVNANPVAADANNRLWAYVASSNEMVRLDPTSQVRLRVGNSARTISSIALSADKRTFYFVNSITDPAGRLVGETYRFSITDGSIPATTPFIRRAFVGLGVDPTGVLYGGVSPFPNQPGYVLRYQPGGALIDSVRAEVAPSKFYFR